MVGCVSQISESNILQIIAQNCSYLCCVDIKLKNNTSAEAAVTWTLCWPGEPNHRMV